MNRPLHCADNTYQWYRIFPQDAGVSHDDQKRLTDHWLPAATFDKLTGGNLLPMLGIRIYASEADALAALRRG